MAFPVRVKIKLSTQKPMPHTKPCLQGTETVRSPRSVLRTPKTPVWSPAGVSALRGVGGCCAHRRMSATPGPGPGGTTERGHAAECPRPGQRAWVGATGLRVTDGGSVPSSHGGRTSGVTVLAPGVRPLGCAATSSSQGSSVLSVFALTLFGVPPAAPTSADHWAGAVSSLWSPRKLSVRLPGRCSLRTQGPVWGGFPSPSPTCVGAPAS